MTGTLPGKLPGIKPKRLSCKWLQRHAHTFFSDYESIVLEHVKMKLTKQTRDGVNVDQFTSDFKFAPDNTQTVNKHKALNQKYVASLLYYLTEVLDPLLLSRTKRWREGGDSLHWKGAKEAILKHLPKASSRSTLIELCCLQRQDGELLLDWTNSVGSIRSRLVGDTITLTDRCRIPRISRRSNLFSRKVTVQSQAYNI